MLNLARQLTNKHRFARLGAFSICLRFSKPTISDATTVNNTITVGRQSWNNTVRLADTKEVSMNAAGLVVLSQVTAVFTIKVEEKKVFPTGS